MQNVIVVYGGRDPIRPRTCCKFLHPGIFTVVKASIERKAATGSDCGVLRLSLKKVRCIYQVNKRMLRALGVVMTPFTLKTSPRANRQTNRPQLRRADREDNNLS